MNKKVKVPKSGPPVISTMDLFNAQKTQYNGFAGGYGVHGKTKQKHKKNYQEED